MLADADVDRLAEAFAAFAAPMDLDGLRLTVVQVVSSLVPTTLVAWNEVDPGSGRIEAVGAPEIAPAVHERLAPEFAAHVDEHPVIAHWRSTGDGRPLAISDFLTEEEFHATELYRRFYRPLGAEDQISFVLPDPRVIVGIALNRAQRGFARRDRKVLNLLRPVILQAYWNARDRGAPASTGSVRAALRALGLTDREVDAVMLAADAHPNKEIGARLAISVRTVEKHLQRGFDKLGVDSRVGAANLLHRLGGRTPASGL